MRAMERDALESLCEEDREYAEELYRKYCISAWIAAGFAAAALVLAVLLWRTQGWTAWETLTVFSLPVGGALTGYLYLKQRKFSEFLEVVPEFRLPADPLTMFKHAKPDTAKKRELPIAVHIAALVLLPPVGIALLAIRRLHGHERIIVANAEDALNARANRLRSALSWSGMWLFLCSLSMMLIGLVFYAAANFAVAARNAAAKDIYRTALDYQTELLLRDEKLPRETVTGSFGASAEADGFAAYLQNASIRESGWFAVVIDDRNGAILRTYFSPHALTDAELEAEPAQGRVPRGIIASIRRWRLETGCYAEEKQPEEPPVAETTAPPETTVGDDRNG